MQARRFSGPMIQRAASEFLDVWFEVNPEVPPPTERTRRGRFDTDSPQHGHSPMSAPASPLHRHSFAPFPNELAMCAPLEHWLHSRGFLTKREFSLPWGICDLVAARFPSHQTTQRLESSHAAPLSSLELLQLLDLIPHRTTRRAITTQRLERLLAGSRSPTQVHNDIQRLKTKRLVHFPRRHHVQKLVSVKSLRGRIIAVEMKLNRVTIAIAQASAHLAVADHSYVALPVALAHRLLHSARRHEFYHHRVGLLSVSPIGTNVLISHKPLPPTEPHRLFKRHCIERFWKMWLTNNAS